MTNRSTDTDGRSFFRSERMIIEGDKWYFHTREGTIEGPFSCKHDALIQLDMYIRVQQQKYLSREYDQVKVG